MKQILAIDDPAANAERVPIRIPWANPIDEFDTQLISSLTSAHEFGFIELHVAHEAEDRWNGRFADTDRANLRRFDQIWRCCLLSRPCRRVAKNRELIDRAGKHDHSLSTNQGDIAVLD